MFSTYRHITYQTNAESSIELLVNALASDDIALRSHAFRALIRRGTIATVAVAELLKSPNERVRWEATKALGKIGGKDAAEALAAALDDESLDVRWLAADGLIAIGMVSLVPLLRGLIHRPESALLREASRHVLRSLLQNESAHLISPVLSSLEAGIPVEEVPVAAHDALNKMRQSRSERPASFA